MNEETTLDLTDIWNILRKRIALIIIITFGATILSGIASFFIIKPTYEARISLVIGKTGTDKNSEQNFSNNDVVMYQNLIKTYTEIAKSKTVASKVLTSLGDKNYSVEQIMGLINVSPKPNTQILEISAKSKTPESALEMVKLASDAFMEEGMRIFPTGDIKLIDKPELPERPVSPNKKLNVLIGFVLGFMVSLGIAFVLEYMDNTLKTEEDIEKYLDLPVIGIVPKNLD